MSDRRVEGKAPFANSLLDHLLSIPMPVFLAGFALGTTLAALPLLLTIHAVA